MNIVSLGLRFIYYSGLVLLSCQLSESIPQHGKQHNHGHGWGHVRQQQQHPPPCQSGEQYPKPGGVSIFSPDNTRNQEASPNFQVPENNGPLKEPDGGQIKPNLDIGPQPPLPSIGIQIIPPPKNNLNPVEQQPPAGGCPEGSGIYRKTGLCYKFASTFLGSEELSPCGSPFMEFYHINGSLPAMGDCDCKSQHLGVPRPIVYWEKSDECFWLFSTGPCQADEWLIFNEKDEPICNKRSCPENTLEDWSPTDGNKKFWFRHRGKCYKSDEKGFCDNPELKIYLEIKEQRYDTECKKFDIESKTLLNGAKPLPCLPGHKASAAGDCRKSASFE